MNLRNLAIGMSIMVSTAAGGQQPSVQLFAAGSLRAPMTEIAQAFTASAGLAVNATYGPSGLLRQRIEKGEPADVFASADVGSPQALARAGRASPPVVFARNRMCALVAPGVAASADTLLDLMLDPQVRLGTSTPKADPSGDYAWQVFEKAEHVRPGAFKTLDAKALKLTGGPNSPPPPADRSIYGVVIAERKADVFLTYCTNALQSVSEVHGAQMIGLPEALAVGADYGLTTMKNAPPGAERLAEFILSQQGQSILARHGFAPGGTR
jgi:ABC-type molybdate transport system substrate-binding protein